MYKLNDKVETTYTTGTISKIYSNYWVIPTFSMTKREWLEQQLIPFTEDELYEAWYEIKCDDGGSVITCESKLRAM